MYIDESVYPDLDVPPVDLATPHERADYVHRVCSAWDFYVHPEPATFALFAEWRDLFDRFPIVTSPAYHAFRAWFGWESVSVPLGVHPPTAQYAQLDALEGRLADPSEDAV